MLLSSVSKSRIWGVVPAWDQEYTTASSLPHWSRRAFSRVVGAPAVEERRRRLDGKFHLTANRPCPYRGEGASPYPELATICAIWRGELPR